MKADMKDALEYRKKQSLHDKAKGNEFSFFKTSCETI